MLPVDRERPGDQESDCLAVAEDMLKARPRMPRIDRNIGVARLQDAEQADQHLERPVQHDDDACVILPIWRRR